MRIGTSLLVFAAGAILRFAVTVTTTGFNLNTIGIILMVVGGVGFVLSLVFWDSGGFGGSFRKKRTTVEGPEGVTSSTTEERVG